MGEEKCVWNVEREGHETGRGLLCVDRMCIGGKIIWVCEWEGFLERAW